MRDAVPSATRAVHFRSSPMTSSRAVATPERYETHLSREIDRVLNRLERLQRMRQGKPLPPPDQGWRLLMESVFFDRLSLASSI
jgi:hypothetical protein